jgi:hypothetical protein
MDALMQLKERDFDGFFKVPMAVYPKELGFVSLLKSDLERFLSLKNPLFKSEKDFSFWVAYRDAKPVGRILAHLHRASNELFAQKRAYFGYFDCENNLETARALLTKAEEFARGHGMSELIGNFNMTAMQQIGVVTQLSADYHYTDQAHAPEYIAQLLADAGFSPTFPMVTHESDIQALNPEALLGAKQKNVLNDPAYRFVDLKSRPVKEIIEAMRHCLNSGFIDNPMFVPLTWDEIYFQAKDMMLVIDRHISSMVEHNGTPIGVIVCIPNLNPFLKAIGSQFGVTMLYHFLVHKFRRDSAVIIFYSVDKKYHELGVNGAMLYKTMAALKQRGYKKLGGTWISLENKSSLRQVEKINGRVMHELALFRKELT